MRKTAMANLDRLKLLFDLNGFVRVRGVLSKEEVASANAAIDANQFVERTGSLRNTADSTLLSGDSKTGRKDMAGMLGWQAGQRETFRNMLCHPKLVEILHELVGEGYRLDHSPLVLAQDRGSEGFSLHGGPLLSDGRMNPFLQYRFDHNSIYNSLVAVSFQLTDCKSGDGGFCVVPGSHKLNFPLTEDMMLGRDAEFMESHVQQPETQAGDVIIFSEATVHGCLPWSASHQRRVALFRFSPANAAFARGYSNGWPPSFLEDMSEEQLAVMQPPYHRMYDRKCLTLAETGVVNTTSKGRSQEKKDFDKFVFGSPYY